MTQLTRVLPRLHFGLLGLWPGGLSSNPNREGGSVSTRLMASHDAHSSASSLTSGYWCERKLWTSGGDFGSFGNQRYHHQNASNDPKGDGIRPNIVLGSMKESEF